ncbi:enoyl-ACP reductase FabI [Roseovarius salinarum]|uniref:enoyl-ACP reductase FabI n=1 Tax=Roseovarius salinarum TaxID=1981892 RepID=UPI000C31E8CF|nr:enoyl-ACP reductase FabI [Roseovarius salinarum]
MYSLAGKRALVTGIANDQSIAWGCARAFRAMGAELAVTYLNERAEPHVRPLAESLEARIVAPLDVTRAGQAEALFATIADDWGGLDILLHSIAFCPKDDLHARVLDCSAHGFATAMDVSVHSFLRLMRLAEPLMGPGATCMTVSFEGADRVVEHYNVMGPVKAALESVTRYAAAELGERGISVHALSPGPLSTRAASGIDHFDDLLAEAARRAPTHRLATIDDVGAYAAFLASDAARNVTGVVHPIDGGHSIMG